MALGIAHRLEAFRVGSVEVGPIVKETIREVGDDDVPGLAAEMAYHSILAVFPFLLFLTGLTAIIDNMFGVGDLTQRIVDRADNVMPDDAVSLIESFTDEVVNSRGGWAMLIGLTGSLWAASSAIGSAMKALNRAYDVKEDRGFVRRKLLSLALTVLFSGALLLAALLLSTGGLVAGGIGRPLGWSDELAMLWNAVTPVLALTMLMFGVAMLYWLAPNSANQLKWITPGAVLFVAGWIAASLAFAFYVSNFASYNRTYGSIGAVIILLIWLYWSNFLMLLGGELNAVVGRRHDETYRQGPNRRSDRPSPAQP